MIEMIVNRIQAIFSPARVLAIAVSNVVLVVYLFFNSAFGETLSEFQIWVTVSVATSITGLIACSVILFNRRTGPSEMGLLSFDMLLFYFSSLIGSMLWTGAA